MKENLLGTIIWSIATFYYSRMMKIMNLAILKIKIGKSIYATFKTLVIFLSKQKDITISVTVENGN